MVIVVGLVVVVLLGSVVVQMMNGMQNHCCSCNCSFFYECFVPLPTFPAAFVVLFTVGRYR